MVQVGNQCSTLRGITTGVPQGAVLSPLLFNVFINDIPLGITRRKTRSFSTLFADDLATYFVLRRLGQQVESVVQSYLDKLTAWLNLNRLEVNVKKSCFSMFALSPPKKKFNFRLSGELVQRDSTPRFLGVVFDERLSFSEQVEHIRKKCFGRLNILRIFSHRSWKLNSKTLLNIYRVLIASVIEYSAFIIPCISSANIKLLQVIQNKAVRIIFRQRRDCPTAVLTELSGLDLVKIRCNTLTCNYFKTAIATQNPLIIKLIEEYDNQISFFNKDRSHPTLLCQLRSQISTNQ